MVDVYEYYNNGKKFIFRSVSLEDSEKLIEYLKLTSGETEYLSYSPEELNLTVEMEEKYIEKYIDKKDKVFIIADITGEIAGKINFEAGKTSRTKHSGELSISVRKKYWGLGIGRQLISCLLKWSRDNQIVKRIELQVRRDNESAIELYKKMGFEIEGIMKQNLYVNGHYYDSYIMGLLL